MDVDPVRRGARAVLEEMVDIVSLAYPTTPVRLSRTAPSKPSKGISINNVHKRKSPLKTLLSSPKKTRVESPNEEEMKYTPPIVQALAKKLIRNCHLCSKNAVMYIAVHNMGIVYLCSETCHSRFKLSRKNYSKTKCVRCLGPLDPSSLSFRPTFGFTDRPCCSESCLDSYNQLKAPTFMCRYGPCNLMVQTTSFRWQTMEFCQLSCLVAVFRSFALRCHECDKKLNAPCQVSQRFGILLKYFCTQQCLKSFLRKNNRRCPSCNAIIASTSISMHDPYCSEICASIAAKRQAILSSIKEHAQPGEICDICKCFIPLVDIEAKFHNHRFITIDADRYVFICSSKCTAAYRQHHRIAKNMCAVCDRHDWPGTGIFYRSGPYDIFIFCSSNCLSIYIYSTKNVIICDLCGRQKSFASAIEEYNLQNGSSKYYCSLRCSRVTSESNNLLAKYPNKLCVIKCAHCRCLSKTGIHEYRASSDQVISFCCSYCHLQGPSSPIVLRKLEIKKKQATPPPPPVSPCITGSRQSAEHCTPPVSSPVVSAKKSLFNGTQEAADQVTTSTPPSNTTGVPSAAKLTIASLLGRTTVICSPNQSHLINAPRSDMINGSALASLLANCPAVTTSAAVNSTQLPPSLTTSTPAHVSTFWSTYLPTQSAPHPITSTPKQSTSLRIATSDHLDQSTAASFTRSSSSCFISPRPQFTPQTYLSMNTSHLVARDNQPTEQVQLVNSSQAPGNFTSHSVNLTLPSGHQLNPSTNSISIPVRIGANGQINLLQNSVQLPRSVTVTPVAPSAQMANASVACTSSSLTIPQMMHTISTSSSQPSVPKLRYSTPANSTWLQPPLPVVASAPVATASSRATDPPAPLPPLPPPPPPSLPASSPASAALPNGHLILVKECVKPKQCSNASVQAAPKMVSKAVMCKPIEKSSPPEKPKMVSIEIQTDISWLDDADVMVIESRSTQVKKLSNGVNK